MLEKLLVEAINKNVSDIHITSDQYIRIRRKKAIIKLDTYLTSEQVIEIAKEILKDKYSNLAKELQIDGSNQIAGVRYRYNIYYEKSKIAIAIRVINNKILSIDELKLPQVLKNTIKQSHGLILVTGPTGSGKSTTLAAIINEINTTTSKHIVTIEDPIEFIFEDDKSIIHQREVGTDTGSFNDALRS
ncbi:MAG: ATPase, T2SS/T4P/T4SS family, partial [Candidatus Izemoplasma sp.]